MNEIKKSENREDEVAEVIRIYTQRKVQKELHDHYSGIFNSSELCDISDDTAIQMKMSLKGYKECNAELVEYCSNLSYLTKEEVNGVLGEEVVL